MGATRWERIDGRPIRRRLGRGRLSNLCQRSRLLLRAERARRRAYEARRLASGVTTLHRESLAYVGKPRQVGSVDAMVSFLLSEARELHAVTSPSVMTHIAGLLACCTCNVIHILAGYIIHILNPAAGCREAESRKVGDPKKWWWPRERCDEGATGEEGSIEPRIQT